jgi:hypothetical protein
LAGDLLKLITDNNKETAREAATALANLRDAPTFSALVKSVRQIHTSDPFLVHSIGVALAASAGTSDLQDLFSLLSDRRATVREIAAIAVGLWSDAHKDDLHANGAEAARLLRGLLRDASSGVQQRAAEALGVLACLGEREALSSVEELRNVMLRGRVECRLAAALALGEAAARGAAADEAALQRFMQITKLPRLSHAVGLCRVALMTVTEQSGGVVAGGTAPIPENRLKMIAEKKEKYDEDKKKKEAPLNVADSQPGFRYRDTGRICGVCPNKQPKNTTSPATMPSEPVRPAPKTAPIDGLETADNGPKNSSSGGSEPEHRAPMSAATDGDKKSGENSGATKSIAPPLTPEAPKTPGVPGSRRHILGTGVNPYAPETSWIYTTYLRVLDE